MSLDSAREATYWKPFQSSGSQTNNPLRFYKFILIVLLVLICFDRVRTLVAFGFRYADEDQTLLWYTTSEMWHLRFHEPCFYGQAYNPPLESALAIPLYAIGIPLPYALPLVTSALALLPFWLLSWAAWRRKVPLTAIMILLIPLLMPISYGMVTSMPRGFVTGIAIGTTGICLMLRARTFWHWFVVGFIYVLAVTLNPNVLILLLAAQLYAWIKYFLNWRYYIGQLAGAAIAGLAPGGIYEFYRRHPLYELHVHKPLKFDWDLWHQGIKNVDVFFGHFVPIIQDGWITIGILIVLIIMLLLVRQYRAAMGIISASALTLFTLGVNRIHEGSNSIFLSSFRMYLAIPVLWALAAFWVGEGTQSWRLSARTKSILTIIILALAALILIPRHWNYRQYISAMLRDRRLDVWSVSEIRNSAKMIGQVAKEHRAPVILFTTNQGKALNYAVPALTNGACETLFPPFERRTWRLEEEASSKQKYMLVYIEDAPRFALFAKDMFKSAKLVSDSPRVLCVETDNQTMLDVAKRFDVRVRPF